MEELMLMVEKLCGLEEQYAERAALGIPNPPTIQATSVTLPPTPKPATPAQMKKQINIIKSGKKKGPKEHGFVTKTTVFNVPIYGLLRTIMRLPFFRWVEGKLEIDTRDPNQDPKKRCSYNDELGHYTTACQPFKAHLEQLVAQGHLDQWIDSATTPAGRRRTKPSRTAAAGRTRYSRGLVNKETEAQRRSELD